MPEGRDWVAVSAGRCPDCGLPVGRLDPRSLPLGVAATGERWTALLAGATDALRARPAPGTWSALEYGAHVAGVFAVFAQRVERVLAEDEPELGWWDHEAAAVDEAYNDQTASTVALRIAAAAARFGELLDAVPDHGWDRAGVRRSRERFTVAGLGRFALHESHHHLADAGRALAVASGADPRIAEVGGLLGARRLAGPVDPREEAAIGAFEGELSRLDRPFEEEADPTHVTSSAIVVAADGTRVLLHRHKRLGLWLQPGGHVEAGEGLAAAAVREAVEETGLELVHPAPGACFVHVDVHAGGRGHRHLDLRWLLVGEGDPAPAAGESPEVRWFGWDEAIDIADPGLAGALAALRA